MLKKILSDKLEILNYTLLPYNNKTNDIIFYKELSSGVISTLGVYHSNLYQKKITGAYYMALSYTWSMATPVFLPDNACQHINSILSLSDKKKLLDKEYWNSSNAWWNSSNEKEILNFVNSIYMTEKIFLKNEESILSNIRDPFKYHRYKVYMSILDEVLNSISEHNILSINKDLFCKIAESVLKRRKDIMNNSAGIKLITTDVCNCYCLSTQKNRLLIKEIAGIKPLST
jgi:hypothetical protein